MKAQHHRPTSQISPTGILLTNVGSPEAPTAQALRPYLDEFLSDPRIVDYPRWLWLPILRGIILRIRPRRSAQLYQNIWTANGSPLLHTLEEQAERVRARLADRNPGEVRLEIGLRYGQPSIAAGLDRLLAAGVRRLLIFPLFPQYSDTTTGTTMDAVRAGLDAWPGEPEPGLVESYHDHPAYIRALADSIREYRQAQGAPDRLLFSYHGIPQRYTRRGDPYRAHCKRTTALVARALGLEAGEYAMAFQSRFGPEPWLQPYTDELLESWAEDGVQNVHVICPGFSADCLETIDEIDREYRHVFMGAGGETFGYIPALNDRPDHIDALVQIIEEHVESAEESAPENLPAAEMNR